MAFLNKKVSLVILTLFLGVGLTACSDADVASYNVSKAADQFEVNRRVVFYNGISGEYILVVQGYCSLGNYDEPGELSVTCKVGEGEYKKHFLGLSDNVTYFAEQIDGEKISKDAYKIIFKPSTIIPDIDIE